MTWTHSASTRINTKTLSADLRDFKYEVARNNVPGFESEFIIGLNRNVGGTLEDVWGAESDIVFPTVEEQWEVVSDDANDTFGGTGANVVAIIYLDDNYELQSDIAFMNGVTAVVFASTNFFRPIRVVVVSTGSANANVGNITVQVTPDGAPRNFMFADMTLSFDGHFTVEEGFEALLVYCEVNAGRQDGVELRVKRSIGAGNTLGVVLLNNIFENVVVTSLPIPINLPARTDVLQTALNTGAGGGADCFAVCEFVLVEIGA